MLQRAVIVISLTAGCGAGKHPDSIGTDAATDADADADTDSDSDPVAPPGMVLVPEGSFWMGCDPDTDTCDYSWEGPYRQVRLSSFFIDSTEVTQAAYQACVDAGRCSTDDTTGFDPSAYPDHPIMLTTWEPSTAYCEWMGQRLPTEAEWEKAARGTDGRIYPWGNETPDCSLAVARCEWLEPVGSLPAGASPYGALDMAGNVAEWVSDWFSPTYYSESPAEDPPGPATGSVKVTRGGHRDSGPFELRSAYRGYRNDPERLVEGLVGFRCAASVAE